MSGYGVLPGFAVAGLEHTGDLLTAMNWQGRRLDPTGFYDMGARFYDPEGRKFLSPDPLGHASSMDLYNYANGDPINHIDPDGRLARMIGGAASALFEFGRASATAFGDVSEFLGVTKFMGGMGAAARDMSEFMGGSAVDWLMGRSLDRYGPTFEGVAVWNRVMQGVQMAALPLSFVGGPVGIIAMGAGSFASFTQGDLVGAAMGGRGTLGAVKAAGGLVRAEIGVMSSGRSMISGGSPLMSTGGQVGRNFAGTAPQPWGMAAKKPNLNSNGATSKFGIYEIETPVGLEKVGKADLNRVTRLSGLPTRIHQQVRKLEKVYGQGNVKGTVVEDLDETTTAAAKAAENARIKRIIDDTGQVPPGNIKSYKP